MSGKGVTVFVVGAFPPPLHGLSHATSSMAKFFADSGLSTMTLDTAHINDRVRSTSKFLRAIARLHVLCRLIYLCATHRRNAVLYMAASAGLGQLGEMAYPLVARIFGTSVIIHHHSFAYLDRHSAIAGAFFRVCGSSTVHVLLCEYMADLMRQKYSVKHIVVLSNAGIMDIEPLNLPKERRLRTIGFLGNITRDKGIDTFIKLMGLLRERNIDVRGRVAGPVVDADCRDLVEAAVRDGLISYGGAVYGDDKLAFLGDVDVLFFPSRYRNEAEPFVILEALASGIPVIATRRGCTSALVDERNGFLLESVAPDLDGAVARVQYWMDFPDAFVAVRHGALAKMRSLLEDARVAKMSLTPGFVAE
jgi:glycosyltransferase involved in cell wall biosynthesis